MKIVFAGTPEFANVALTELLNAGHKVLAVFTQPDRPSGRGLKLSASPVKQTALAHNITLCQPRSLRLDGKYPEDAQAAKELLLSLDADVMVVAAYGLILPQWVLDAPKAGCINIHASLLPRWRGAAPLQRAIEAGDAVSGVCLMQMDEGLDTGAVHARASISISEAMTGDALHDALSALGANLLCEHLPEIVLGRSTAVPQEAMGVSYAKKLNRSDGHLDWQQSSVVLANRIRAFDSAIGCYFECGALTFKVWAATAIQTSAQTVAHVGTVLNLGSDGLEVACNGGILNITEIQKPGGKRMAVSACWQHLGITSSQILT